MGQAVAQEVAALKASLEVERKEHERTKVMQKMLEDQIRRAGELRTLSGSITDGAAPNGGVRGSSNNGGSGATDPTAGGAYLLSSDWLQRILVLSGLLLALGACAHLSGQDGTGGGMSGGGGGGGSSLSWTPRKAPSHIV